MILDTFISQTLSLQTEYIMSPSVTNKTLRLIMSGMKAILILGICLARKLIYFRFYLDAYQMAAFVRF